ncbi:transcription initiation factor IIB [Thermococci archaeon]|uniref:transcription initiation factor IIB n=1 Tax=Palaeococcus sp. (in: euryarchaeotes) TaxID=2820298 RepID=UPI000F1C495F|nr:transcription initiation factor IIB [Palaeococcus sp. (in: euryarchaeotes)]MCD6558439.1 transcription initiation factor IIB [Palaeococcus sp. (in: euryarchaeotes)]RLF75592.1 MAG: transcription initiation factor IIB [Thermococci archaeon]RLF90595.1 MAG: transcription initiation factor IIB [Thermococci archaeon]
MVSAEDVKKCPICGSEKLIYDPERGEIVCAKCGYVVAQNIVDSGPEWRAFDADQRARRGRVGAPVTYTIHDKGLSTMIDWRNKDIHGHDISSTTRAQMYRLRKWQRRIRVSDAAERNLAFALSELDRMASQLQLPRNLKEMAAVLYRKAVMEHLIRGRSIEGVTAACLYAACRMAKIPRTLDEIEEVARVDKKEIGRSYRFIARELNLKLPPTNPIDYVGRFADQLGLSERTKRKAIEILKQAVKRGLTSGRGPMGVAAAALYIASVLEGEKRTQREVAEVAHVTEVTVRNRYKELVEKLGIKLNI